jgi:hypothetical protein
VLTIDGWASIYRTVACEIQRYAMRGDATGAVGRSMQARLRLRLRLPGGSTDLLPCDCCSRPRLTQGAAPCCTVPLSAQPCLTKVAVRWHDECALRGGGKRRNPTLWGGVSVAAGEPDDYLLSHGQSALSSAWSRFTVLFGMGRGGTDTLWSSGMTGCRVALGAPQPIWKK